VLLNLNDNFVDPSKVSFVSKIDNIVYHHTSTITHHFDLVVDGCQMRITCHQKEEVASFRDTLLAKVALTLKT